jgi:ATP-dependent Lhr-like helicase
MELSGEVVTGRFFEDVPGIQFASLAAARALAGDLPADAVYWLNATDPASACGIDLPALKSRLPSRLGTTHLVFLGRRVVLVSRRGGKDVDISVEPDHARLTEFMGVFRHMVGRSVQPMPKVKVEHINGIDAADSPFADAFKQFGFRRDYKLLVLWRMGAG